MPIIYKNKEGKLVKEGTNGCTDCGLPLNNTKVLDEPIEKDIVSKTKPKAKKTTKKEVTNDDD